jgi:ribosomal protein S18 acetylase RimI-like enzyme
LLTKILETLQANTLVKKVQLMVNTDEEPAKHVYEKMRFVITETVDYPMGDGKNHKLYKMEKVLQ